MPERHDERTDALYRLAALYDVCDGDIIGAYDIAYWEEDHPPLISPYVALRDCPRGSAFYLLAELFDPWAEVAGDDALADDDLGDRLQGVINLDHWTILSRGPQGWCRRRLPVEEERSG
jgi:hypothetical protein